MNCSHHSEVHIILFTWPPEVIKKMLLGVFIWLMDISFFDLEWKPMITICCFFNASSWHKVMIRYRFDNDRYRFDNDRYRFGNDR
jgi:hypothetical protein